MHPQPAITDEVGMRAGDGDVVDLVLSLPFFPCE